VSEAAGTLIELVITMRRGQENHDDLYGNDPANGWTKQVLVEAAGISTRTFDTIRKAARVRGPSHGGLNWVFSVENVIALIRRAESGTFSDRGKPIAATWRELMIERGMEMPD